MKRIPVKSSNIKSIGYAKDLNILEIEFTNGNIYDYSGVKENEFNSLMEAKSKGKFFHSFIINSHSSIKIN